MPTSFLHCCTVPGCPELLPKGQPCPKHPRRSAHARGYTRHWATYSRRRLAQYPWCVGYPTGRHTGAQVLAECTDHILSAKAYPHLFWEETNHQSLCSECNTRKALAEEGGFGR